MATQTDDTKTLKRITKLFEALEELATKDAEIRAEIMKLLRGEPAMGDLVKAAMLHFGASWKIRYRSEYAWRFAIDTPHLKRLIKLLGPEELHARMTAYMVNNEDYFKRARHSFGVFVSTVNQHAGQGADASEELELASAPADCRHKPPCRSDVEHTRRMMEDRSAAQAASR
jgi:hypothetical protein